MASDLRLRISEDLGRTERPRRIEVLDSDGKVLGDLGKSVSNVTWKMGIGGIGIVSIDVGCERATIDSLEHG